MADKKTVAVTGATGQQGGAVTRALLEKGFSVRALSRNPGSERAVELGQHGVELVRADFDDPQSLQDAFRGAEAAFIVSTPFEAGVERETEQGIRAVEAAKAAGVGHVVFSSVAGANNRTGVPHFDSKFRVEQHLQSDGVPYTIIAPAFFYDNMLAAFALPNLKQGTFAQALPAGIKLQCVATDSIGSFAAHVFANPDRFYEKRIDIAGDSLTGSEFASALSRAAGRDIKYYEVPLDQVKSQSEDMALMYDWFEKVGYSIDISSLKHDYPDVKWPSFSEWAGRQDWSVLN